jgi:hypothetical protein
MAAAPFHSHLHVCSFLWEHYLQQHRLVDEDRPSDGDEQGASIASLRVWVPIVGPGDGLELGRVVRRHQGALRSTIEQTA